MKFEEQKRRLDEYNVQMGRLERKCEEAARWTSMAEGGEADSSNRIKVTAMQMRSECEDMAEHVRQLRAQLVSAFEQVTDARQREVLELYYLQGRSTKDIQSLRVWSSRYIRRLRTEAIQSLDENSNFFKKS